MKQNCNMDITQQPYKHLKLDKFVYGSKQKIIKTTTQIINKDDNQIINYEGNKKNVYYFSNIDNHLIDFHQINFDYINNKKDKITIKSYIDRYNPTFTISANVIKHQTTQQDGQRIAYFPQYIYTPLDIAQFKNSCYFLLPISTNKFVNIAHPNKILNDIQSFNQLQVSKEISSYIEPHKQFYDRAAYTSEDNSIPVYDMNFKDLQTIKFSSINELYNWILKWSLQNIIYQDENNNYHSLINEILFDSVQSMSFTQLLQKNIPTQNCDSILLDKFINYLMTHYYLYSRETINTMLSELFANISTLSVERYFKLIGRINNLNSNLTKGEQYTNIKNELNNQGIYNVFDLMTKKQDVTFTPNVLPQNTLLIDNMNDSIVYEKQKSIKEYFPSCYINFVNLKNNRDPEYQLNCTIGNITVQNDIFLNDYRFSISANNAVNLTGVLSASCLSSVNEQKTLQIVNKAIQYDNNLATNTGYKNLFPQRMNVKRQYYLKQYDDKHICNNKLSSMGTLNGIRNYIHAGTSFNKKVWLNYSYNETKQYDYIIHTDRYELEINNEKYSLEYDIDKDKNIIQLYINSYNKYLVKYDYICDKLYLQKEDENLELLRVNNNQYYIVKNREPKGYVVYYDNENGYYYLKDKDKILIDINKNNYLSTTLNTIFTNFNKISAIFDQNTTVTNKFSIINSNDIGNVYYYNSEIFSNYEYNIENNIINLTNLSTNLYKNDELILTTNGIRLGNQFEKEKQNCFMLLNDGTIRNINYHWVYLVSIYNTIGSPWRTGYILTDPLTSIYNFNPADKVSGYWIDKTSFPQPRTFIYPSTFWNFSEKKWNVVTPQTTARPSGISNISKCYLFSEDGKSFEYFLQYNNNLKAYIKRKFTFLQYCDNMVFSLNAFEENKFNGLKGQTLNFDFKNSKSYSLPFSAYSLNRESQWIKDYNENILTTCLMKSYGNDCPWNSVDSELQKIIGCNLSLTKQCNGFCTYPCNNQIKQSFNDNRGLNWKLKDYYQLHKGIENLKIKMNNGLNLTNNNQWFIIPANNCNQMIIADSDILVNDDLEVFFIPSTQMDSNSHFSDVVSNITLKQEFKSIFQGFWNKGKYPEYRYTNDNYNIAINNKFNGPHIIIKDTIITGIILDDALTPSNIIPSGYCCLMRVKSWWSDTIRCEGNIKVVIEEQNDEYKSISNYDFIQVIDGFFKFKQTGLHKSNIYSINLKNTGLSKLLDKATKMYTKQEVIKLLQNKYFIRYYQDEDSFLVNSDENTFIHAVFDSTDNTVYKRTPLFKNLQKNNLSGFVLNYITIPFDILIQYEGIKLLQEKQLYYYEKEYNEATKYNSIRQNIRQLIQKAIRKSITRYMPADTNLWKVEYQDEQ